MDKAKVTPDSGYLERTLVMSLSPIEIIEEDCGCTDGIQIEVKDEAHAKSLIKKYAKLNQKDKWKLINNLENAKKLIGMKIILRSPMKCWTKDFKICQKCFGERKIRSKYIGIVAGQLTTERLTQLVMRVFHTSGSVTLEKKHEIINFIRDHLADIKETETQIQLIFNTQKISPEFLTIPGFESFDKNIATFNKLEEQLVNEDATFIIRKVKDILKKEEKVSRTPEQYYQDFTEAVLSVGNTFSSFLEMVLAHLFMTSDEDFWRYNYDKPVTCKLSEKTVAAKISPLLGFLYQPNRITINTIGDDILNLIEQNENLSIHERIFLQKYDTQRRIN